MTIVHANFDEVREIEHAREDTNVILTVDTLGFPPLARANTSGSSASGSSVKTLKGKFKMVEKTKGRKEEVVSREYTINLHKRLHGCSSNNSYYEGERLARLLKSIHKEIESTKTLDGNSLPEKFWFKQQFAIGVNEVTRVLERMSPVSERGRSLQQSHAMCTNHKVPSVHLQAILIASDCNPKWLAKHLPSLASSRKVPLIFVKDKRGGSLRLGELVKLKTAIAIGVKARGNAINEIVEGILCGNETNPDTDCQI